MYSRHLFSYGGLWRVILEEKKMTILLSNAVEIRIMPIFVNNAQDLSVLLFLDLPSTRSVSLQIS